LTTKLSTLDKAHAALVKRVDTLITKDHVEKTEKKTKNEKGRGSPAVAP